MKALVTTAITIGVAGIGACVAAVFLDVSERLFFAGLAALAVAFGCGISAAAIQDKSDARACASRGGHMVDVGAPHYVLVGKVVVPIQDRGCEVPR